MELSQKYAKGFGIEIGALSLAWPTTDTMSVNYVDRYSKEELLEQYSDMQAEHIPETNVIDDGRYLKRFQPDFMDFLLNSHVLEHSDNPLKTLERWLEVIRPGKCILGAVPNKDHTFDRDRPLSEFDDLLAAYHGDIKFKVKALESWHQHLSKLEGDALGAAIIKSIESDEHVHFPVWDLKSFANFLERAHEVIVIQFKIEEFIESGGEILFALRRTPK